MLRRAYIVMLTLAVLFAAGLGAPRQANAYSPEIEGNVDATLRQFYSQVYSGRELAKKASAVLVFPNVVKAGFGIGGSYGEGALRIGGRTAGYYNTASASIGFQIGAQGRSVVILFMTKSALRNFRARDGWEIGVDGSVVLITVGAGAEVDTNNIVDPIIGFMFNNKGLMYNLTLEGSKISRIDR